MKYILLAVGSPEAIEKIRMNNASRYQSFKVELVKKVAYLYAVKF